MEIVKIIKNIITYFNENKLTKNQSELKSFYKKNNYPIIPDLPDDKDSKFVLDNMNTFPVVVPKIYMKPLYKNGLIRGHIVMLWWLNNPKTIKKSPPLYLKRDYGLDFNKGIHKLESLGLIDSNNKLTDKGEQLLKENHQIIREHKAHKLIGKNEIKYLFNDIEATEGMTEFKTTGDFIEDQHLGSSFKKRKDYKNAIKAYESAYKLAKKDPLFKNDIPGNIHNQLSVLYGKVEDYKSAINIINEYFRQYPELQNKDIAMNKRLEKYIKKLNESK